MYMIPLLRVLVGVVLVVLCIQVVSWLLVRFLPDSWVGRHSKLVVITFFTILVVSWLVYLVAFVGLH